MAKRIRMLGPRAALALLATPWLSAAAGAGPPFVCGDGLVQVPEVCDDGNTVTGDGCSYPSCLYEACGDSVVNPDPPSLEECDDGNTTDEDGCTDTCQDDCSDGETDAGLGETCDDANEANGDGCDDDVATDPPGNCTVTACGNGVVTPPEECDDGNIAGDDDCEPDCSFGSVILPKPVLLCIHAINKSLAGVLKAQHADDATCVKDVAAGKQPDPGACLGNDLKGKVGKAQGRTAATDARKCQPPRAEPPSFAYTDPATVNDAGETQALEAVAQVLGATPNVVRKSADSAGAKCQGEVMKQLGALSNRWAAEANKAKKRALKGGRGGVPPPAGSSADLAAAIDAALAASTARERAEARAIAAINGKCADVEVASLFGCNGVTTLAELEACVIAAAEQGACEAFEAADDLDLACPGALVP